MGVILCRLNSLPSSSSRPLIHNLYRRNLLSVAGLASIELVISCVTGRRGSQLHHSPIKRFSYQASSNQLAIANQSVSLSGISFWKFSAKLTILLYLGWPTLPPYGSGRNLKSLAVGEIRTPVGFYTSELQTRRNQLLCDYSIKGVL